jgi:hypothetical protein
MLTTGSLEKSTLRWTLLPGMHCPCTCCREGKKQEAKAVFHKRKKVSCHIRMFLYILFQKIFWFVLARIGNLDWRIGNFLLVATGQIVLLQYVSLCG